MRVLVSTRSCAIHLAINIRCGSNTKLGLQFLRNIFFMHFQITEDNGRYPQILAIYSTHDFVTLTEFQNHIISSCKWRILDRICRIAFPAKIAQMHLTILFTNMWHTTPHSYRIASQGVAGIVAMSTMKYASDKSDGRKADKNA